MSLFLNNFPEGVQVKNTGGILSIDIPDKTVLEKPIHLKAEGALNEKILIYAGVSTRVHVLLEYGGEDSGVYQCAREIEVRMADNACVSFCEIHKPGDKGMHQVKNSFYLGKYSDLNYLSFVNGGTATHFKNAVYFEGEHGFASLKGLSVLSEKSEARNVLLVDHKVPHCISRQFYKSILADQSISEFDSLVHVEKDAIKSDSEQLNKNLLLSDKAKAITKPKLKIDADDVACKHGATVGQLETDQLFYLRSRGIPKDEARYILVYGFAEEIIETLEDEPLRKTLEELAGQEIQEALASLKK